MSRPNILFIMADDHRHDAIAARGDSVVQTPHLDQLIASGTHFCRNYMLGGLSGAVCVPARAALHTGSNPFAASVGRGVDVYRDLVRLNPEKVLLAETFRQVGYHTFGTGKWHNCRTSFARSFASGSNIFFGGMSDHDQVPLHDFDPTGQYPDEKKYMGDGFSTDLFSGAAIDFLNTHKEDDPFFLYLAFTAPHDPRTPPTEYAYDPESIALPPNFMDEHPFDNGDMRLRDEVLAEFPRTEREIRQHIADYYGMISHMDAHIGRVLAALEASGKADNTIVVYTADHGLAVGQHGLLGKQNMYEHSVSVPLIVWGPGVPAGEKIEQLSLTYDIYPTLCELAEISVPESVESSSLLPLIRGNKSTLHETVYSHYKDIQRMVSDGRWKLIRYFKSAKDGVGSERIQLFYLVNDPWELADVSADHPREVERLQGELAQWMREIGDPLYKEAIRPLSGKDTMAFNKLMPPPK
jgi:arylsulfatase A-like enzyme